MNPPRMDLHPQHPLMHVLDKVVQMKMQQDVEALGEEPGVFVVRPLAIVAANTQLLLGFMLLHPEWLAQQAQEICAEAFASVAELEPLWRTVNAALEALKERPA